MNIDQTQDPSVFPDDDAAEPLNNNKIRGDRFDQESALSLIRVAGITGPRTRSE